MRIRSLRRIVMELPFLVVALVAVDALVGLETPEPTSMAGLERERHKIAQKLGVAFDTRSVSDVVRDLRREGVDAFPGLSREWPRTSPVRERMPPGFHPLSHASSVSVVECNESGRYLIFQTDEFGFNNPPGLLRSGDVQIAVVGESFALGHCLPPAESFIGRVRARYPRTASVALAGSGILASLASFREYVEPLRPPLVLWIVNPFFIDIELEHDPLLMRYLDPSFSQGLIGRQGEVDEVIRAYAIDAQEAWDRSGRETVVPSVRQRISDSLRLRNLRRIVQGAMREEAPPDLKFFDESLRLAKSTTEGWGGQLVAVLVPTYGEVVQRAIVPGLDHESLKQRLDALAIPVVDTVPEFSAQPDPAALFTMRVNNHPTPAGHALIGDLILADLRQRLPRVQAAGASPAFRPVRSTATEVHGPKAAMGVQVR